MNDQSTSDKFAAIIVALLLILSAWDNATVMLFVSILGLVVFMLVVANKLPEEALWRQQLVSYYRLVSFWQRCSGS